MKPTCRCLTRLSVSDSASLATNPLVRLALTPGEPAGIGPDLAVLTAQHPRDYELVAFANPELLTERAEMLGLPLSLREYDPAKAQVDEAGSLCVQPVPINKPALAGTLDRDNACYVLETLTMAVEACRHGTLHALVTGPVHKGVINEAGIAFTGHTEFIAAITESYPVMMLVADQLRVALATTHIPLSEVPRALTRKTLLKVSRVLHHDLMNRFKIVEPHILVAGLNPHAGEGGHLGSEDGDIIEPALATLREEGINVTGPLPADTLFTPHHLKTADAVLAMYHDQGLPVLKYAGFGNAVNITLGLPIIRTSVDHGTAIDLAGSGNINTGSLASAVSMALDLALAETGANAGKPRASS